MERTIAIIRINTGSLGHEIEDISRLNECGFTNLSFEIPKVQVLKHQVNGQCTFIEKALLFNYGFLRMPEDYAKRPTILNQIKSLSKVISGYFYKPSKDLTFERIRMRERLNILDDKLVHFEQTLIKTVTQQTLDRLFEVARTLDVYDKAEELEIGSYVILQGYPFEGLGAIILDKTSTKVKVELTLSNMIVEIEKGNVYYSAYLEPDLKYNLSNATT